MGVINPTAPFKVVIEAHADEISWFVNYINDQGLIHLKEMVAWIIKLHLPCVFGYMVKKVQ